MPGEDHVMLINDDRLKIAGTLDAVGDTPDLALRACSRVARIPEEVRATDREILDEYVASMTAALGNKEGTP